MHGKTNKALKCNVNNCTCVTCLSIHTDDVPDTSMKKEFIPVVNAKCTDRNVVYALICSKCTTTVYVGETERTVKERFLEHRRDVKL